MLRCGSVTKQKKFQCLDDLLKQNDMSVLGDLHILEYYLRNEKKNCFLVGVSMLNFFKI